MPQDPFLTLCRVAALLLGGLTLVFFGSNLLIGFVFQLCWSLFGCFHWRHRGCLLLVWPESALALVGTPACRSIERAGKAAPAAPARELVVRVVFFSASYSRSRSVDQSDAEDFLQSTLLLIGLPKRPCTGSIGLLLGDPRMRSPTGPRTA